MPRALAVLLVALLALAGCGGDDDGSSSAADGGSTTAEEPVEFPDGSTKTMRGLRSNAPEGAVFSPTGRVLRVGRNRIGFALFEISRAPVDADAVAVYVSTPEGRFLRGPFVAREQSLEVKPQFMSRQTEADLEDLKSFWVADVPFPRKGRYVLTALASVDGEMISTSQIEMTAGGEGHPPDVGDRAVRVHTDTLASAGGDIEAIDTRLPPLPELHEKDLADVLGKEPVVLAFATPQLCASRVCGPVVDVVAQVRNETDGVTFIHQEIFVDNDVEKGFREPVGRWRLPSEPWVFVIGRDGRVVERFEGAVSVAEVRAAVKKVSTAG